jgi:hypothetical protein
MCASGFDNVESILGYDDDNLQEMREELERNGVPTITAVTIVSMLEADTLIKALQTLPIQAAPVTARNASPVGTLTTPPHPHAPPSPMSLTSILGSLLEACNLGSRSNALKDHPLEARLQLSGFGFEVEDEDKLGGWVRVHDLHGLAQHERAHHGALSPQVRVHDCTAAVLRVLIDGGTQGFTSRGDSGRQAYRYEAFRNPATNKLQQRNCQTKVRVTLACPHSSHRHLPQAAPPQPSALPP